MRFIFQENYFLSVNHMQMGVSYICFAIVFNLSMVMLKYIADTYNTEYISERTGRRRISMRVTSTVHAIIVTAMAIKNLIHNEHLLDNKLMHISQEVSLILNIVIGYMAFDVSIMLAFIEICDKVSIFHHIISSTAFYFCSNLGVFSYIAILRLTSEASTPFVNIRWVLLSFQQKGSGMYKYNGLFIVLTFLVFRIIPIIPIWYSYYDGMSTLAWTQISILYKVICVITSAPLDVLNIFWFKTIFKTAMKFFESKEIQENKSN